MTRVIALEDGLEELGEYLKQYGYITISWSKVNGPVDAVIYKGKKLQEIAAASEGLAEQMPGVLLVNAEGKTWEEVHEIIKNRIYDHFI